MNAVGVVENVEKAITTITAEYKYKLYHCAYNATTPSEMFSEI